MKKKPLTEESGEVRELSREEIRSMGPAEESLPSGPAVLVSPRRPGAVTRKDRATRNGFSLIAPGSRES